MSTCTRRIAAICLALAGLSVNLAPQAISQTLADLPDERAISYEFDRVSVDAVRRYLDVVNIDIPIQIDGTFSGWIWAQNQGSFFSLRDYVAHLQINSPQLTIEGFDLRDVDLRLIYEKGSWVLQKLSGDVFNLPGGQSQLSLANVALSGRLPADADAISLNLTLSDGSLGRLLAASGRDDLELDGTATARVSATAPLASIGQIATWKASGNVAINALENPNLLPGQLTAELLLEEGVLRLSDGQYQTERATLSFGGQLALDDAGQFRLELPRQAIEPENLLRGPLLEQLSVARTEELVGSLEVNGTLQPFDWKATFSTNAAVLSAGDFQLDAIGLQGTITPDVLGPLPFTATYGGGRLSGTYRVENYGDPNATRTFLNANAAGIDLRTLSEDDLDWLEEPVLFDGRLDLQFPGWQPTSPAEIVGSADGTLRGNLVERPTGPLEFDLQRRQDEPYKVQVKIEDDASSLLADAEVNWTQWAVASYSAELTLDDLAVDLRDLLGGDAATPAFTWPENLALTGRASVRGNELTPLLSAEVDLTGTGGVQLAATYGLENAGDAAAERTTINGRLEGLDLRTIVPAVNDWTASPAPLDLQVDVSFPNRQPTSPDEISGSISGSLETDLLQSPEGPIGFEISHQSGEPFRAQITAADDESQLAANAQLTLESWQQGTYQAELDLQNFSPGLSRLFGPEGDVFASPFLSELTITGQASIRGESLSSVEQAAFDMATSSGARFQGDYRVEAAAQGQAIRSLVTANVQGLELSRLYAQAANFLAGPAPLTADMTLEYPGRFPASPADISGTIEGKIAGDILPQPSGPATFAATLEPGQPLAVQLQISDPRSSLTATATAAWSQWTIDEYVAQATLANVAVDLGDWLPADENGQNAEVSERFVLSGTARIDGDSEQAITSASVDLSDPAGVTLTAAYRVDNSAGPSADAAGLLEARIAALQLSRLLPTAQDWFGDEAAFAGSLNIRFDKSLESPDDIVGTLAGTISGDVLGSPSGPLEIAVTRRPNEPYQVNLAVANDLSSLTASGQLELRGWSEGSYTADIAARNIRIAELRPVSELGYVASGGPLENLAISGSARLAGATLEEVTSATVALATDTGARIDADYRSQGVPDEQPRLTTVKASLAQFDLGQLDPTIGGPLAEPVFFDGRLDIQFPGALPNSPRDISGTAQGTIAGNLLVSPSGPIALSVERDASGIFQANAVAGNRRVYLTAAAQLDWQDWTTGRYSAAVAASDVAVNVRDLLGRPQIELPPELEDAVQISGRLEVQSDELSSPSRIEFQLDQLRAVYDNQPLGIRDVSGVYTPQHIEIERFHAFLRSQTASGSFFWNLEHGSAEQRPNQLQLTLEAWPLNEVLELAGGPLPQAPLNGSVSGYVDLRQAVGGADAADRQSMTEGWEGQATLSADSLTYADRPIGGMKLVVTTDGETLTAKATGQLFGGAVRGVAETGDEWPLRGILLLEEIELPQLMYVYQGNAADRFAGTATGRVEFGVDGDQQLRGNYRLNVAQLRFDRQDVSERIDLAGTFTDQEFHLRSFETAYAGGRLRGQLDATFEPQLNLGGAIEASGVELSQIIAVFNPDLSPYLVGPVSGRLTPDLQRDRLVLRGAVSGRELEIYSIPIDEGTTGFLMSYRLDSGALDLSLDNIQGQSLEGRLRGDFDLNYVRNARFDGDFELVSGQMRALEDWVEVGEYFGNGIFNAQVSLGAQQYRAINDLNGTLAMQFGPTDAQAVPLISPIAAAVPTVALPQTRFEEGSLDAIIGAGQLRITNALLYNPRLWIAAAGGIGLANQTLDLDVTIYTGSTADSQALLASVANFISYADPTLSAIRSINELISNRTVFLNIGGTARQPVVRLQAARTVGRYVVDSLVRQFTRNVVIPGSAAATGGAVLRND